jgi:hypothetical protein
MPSTISSLVLGALISTICHQQSSSSVVAFQPIFSMNNVKASRISTSSSSAQSQSQAQRRSPSAISIGEDDFGLAGGFSEQGDETNEVRVEPDTHDELMYALGVNLARQLGDIRPLVESGEELAQVAKGLLDTVVGRLNDDGQRLLLSKRGGELDQLIAGRA